MEQGSSFCYLNLGTSGRSILLPEGLSSEQSVRNANLISCRTAALVRIAIALEQIILVEQPNNHRGLVGMPRWQEIFEMYSVYKAVCKQGAYGALSEKPTALFSLHQNWCTMKNELSDIDRKRIEEEGESLVVRKRAADGSMRVTGRRSALKATQAYTLEFGRAIVDCWVAGCHVSWLRSISKERNAVFCL